MEGALSNILKHEELLNPRGGAKRWSQVTNSTSGQVASHILKSRML